MVGRRQPRGLEDASPGDAFPLTDSSPSAIRPGLINRESGLQSSWPDPLNESRASIVIVVSMTTSLRDLPSRVDIDADGSGLDEVNYAKCEDIKPVSAERGSGASSSSLTMPCLRSPALRSLHDLRDTLALRPAGLAS